MINKIISLIISLGIVLILNLSFNEVENHMIFGNVNMMNSIIALTGCYYIVNNIVKNIKEVKKVIFSVLLGIIFTLISVHVPTRLVEIMTNNLVTQKYIKYAVITFVGYFALITSIIFNIFTWWDTVNIKENIDILNSNNVKEKIEKYILGTGIYSYITTVILGLIVFTPILLHNYPGGFSPDVIGQLEHGFFNIPNNAHPYIHTLIFTGIVKFFYMITNNINLSFAIFLYIQAIVFGITVSRVISFMKKYNVDIKIRGLILLSYLLSPVLLLFLMFPWKDILFALIFTNLIVEIIDIILEKRIILDGEKRKINNIFYLCYLTLLVFLTMVIRHNGYYVILITAPIVLIGLKKDISKLILVFLIPLLIYFILNSHIYPNVLKMKRLSESEKYSIPMQIIARIGKYRDQDLTEEDRENIRGWMEYDRVRKEYVPWISDRAKFGSNSDRLIENPKEFLKLSMDLAKRFPNEAFLAVVEQTEGYYSPESLRLKIDVGFTNFEKMKIHRWEELPVFEKAPKLNLPIVDKVFSVIYNRNLMIINLVTSIGLVVWGIIVSLAYIINKKDYELILPYIPVGLFVLTCIASPVSGDLRYGLPLFMLIPVFILLPVLVSEKSKEKIKEIAE